MSLILEALRKSEAERHRGLPPRLDSPMLRPTRRRQRLAPGLALLVLGAPAAGWFVYRGMAPDFAESQDTSLAALLPPLNQGADPGSAETVASTVSAANVSAAGTAGNPAAAAQSPVVSVVDQSISAVAVGSNGTPIVGGSFAAAQDLPMPQRMRPHTASARAPVQPAMTTAPVTAPAVADKTMAVAPVASPAPPPAQTQAPTAPPVPVAAATSVSNPTPNPAASVEVASIAPTPAIAPAVTPAPVRPEIDEAMMVPVVYDLSYEIRREMPKLDMSMHVYSGDRAARFIVLNGKRLQEGSTTAESEVQLVEIRRAGAVMSFRGTNFLLPRQGM